MENPDCVSIAKIFVLELLCTLVKSYWNLLLLLLRSYPGIENWLFFEIEIKIFDLQANINLEVKISSWVERYVSIDIFLVVEARIKVEDAEFSGYFHELKDILVRLFVFYVSQVLWAVDMLKHKILVILDRELFLLVN